MDHFTRFCVGNHIISSAIWNARVKFFQRLTNLTINLGSMKNLQVLIYSELFKKKKKKYIYIYIYTRLQKRCNFKVYMIYICLLSSHQKGVDRKNNRGPFLQKERTIATVKPFEGFV